MYNKEDDYHWITISPEDINTNYTGIQIQLVPEQDTTFGHNSQLYQQTRKTALTYIAVLNNANM